MKAVCGGGGFVKCILEWNFELVSEGERDILRRSVFTM